jgi:hypothetical protein
MGISRKQSICHHTPYYRMLPGLLTVLPNFALWEGVNLQLQRTITEDLHISVSMGPRWYTNKLHGEKRQVSYTPGA